MSADLKRRPDKEEKGQGRREQPALWTSASSRGLWELARVLGLDLCDSTDSCGVGGSAAHMGLPLTWPWSLGCTAEQGSPLPSCSYLSFRGVLCILVCLPSPVTSSFCSPLLTPALHLNDTSPPTFRRPRPPRANFKSSIASLSLQRGELRRGWCLEPWHPQRAADGLGVVSGCRI